MSSLDNTNEGKGHKSVASIRYFILLHFIAFQENRCQKEMKTSLLQSGIDSTFFYASETHPKLKFCRENTNIGTTSLTHLYTNREVAGRAPAAFTVSHTERLGGRQASAEYLQDIKMSTECRPRGRTPEESGDFAHEQE